LEYDRSAAVEQQPVLGMPVHGSCKRKALGVAAQRGQVRGGHGVIDPGDLLFDDGVFVELTSTCASFGLLKMLRTAAISPSSHWMRVP
jgi:hypothetical protein